MLTSPFPASLMHIPGNPSRSMPWIIPEQPVLEETPAVRLTFSSSESWATKALAFLYAEAQSPAPIPWAIHVNNQDVGKEARVDIREGYTGGDSP